MTDNLKKNNVNFIEEYISNITIKCESHMPKNQWKKYKKIDNNNLTIPTIKTYNELFYFNYNISQLKIFTKHYKLKISGNKQELISRLFTYLYFSSYIIKIQKVFRKFLVTKYKNLHGPAHIERKLCTNNSDFITLEPIEEICFHQFFSFKDIDGFIYGFDINSLHNLFLKTEYKNPYNRNEIPSYVLKNIKKIIKISKILNININLIIEDDTQNLSNEKNIELRALSLFQNIDALGNYSNPNWFLSLSRNNLVKFIRELADIWNYRAQLQNQIKRNICPPYGNPFVYLNFIYIHTEENLWNVKKVILEVIEKLVNSGVDRDSKSLGAFYVLGTLTLVNNDAATCLPWLFHSFCHFQN